MKKLAVLLATGVVLLASAPVALADSPRADSFYVVHCTDDQGNPVEAEAVDAHAIEQGGKAHAIELFSRNFPFGWTCWAEGPFSS